MRGERNRVIVGDALAELRRLPEASVDCVITSPPYFALRNYGVEGQVGLEAHVEQWVTRLLRVAAEIKRVLKPEGAFWLNLGDSYARHPSNGAPPKSLVLAPERLLLALSAEGWLVRNKIVWAKTNPMPTSVKDRLSCTWEPLYLLVRSSKYFFDLNTIRIPHRSKRSASSKPFVPRPRPNWSGPLAGDNSGLDRLKAAGLPGHRLGKNPGDVWQLAKSGYRGGHCATFPEGIVERPLLASCPERTCSNCGQAWRRAMAAALGNLAVRGVLHPACNCGTGWRPGLVLDPFIGSGTTAVVAKRLGRDWLGIELNPEYAAMARRRVGASSGDSAMAA